MCWRVKKQCLPQSASMVCFHFCQTPSFVDMFARAMLCDVLDMETGNKIGVRGVSALCDALKDNTTLTVLDIGGEVP